MNPLPTHPGEDTLVAHAQELPPLSSAEVLQLLDSFNHPESREAALLWATAEGKRFDRSNRTGGTGCR